jgi:phage baseplate assembly protein gpV
MIEETLTSADESIESIRKKFYGVTTGRVINVLDPLMLGRVQLQLPFIDALDLSPWARVATPMVGQLAGSYFIPNIGDEVLVAFEHGDAAYPYVLGCLWTALAPPPLPSPLPQVRAIRTLTGNQIVFTEAPPSVTIQTAPTPPVVLPAPPSPVGPYQTITMNPTGVEIATPTMVQIAVGTTQVVVTPLAVSIVVGPSTLTMTAAGVVIHGPTLTLTADGPVTIRGATVLIN